MTKPLLALLVLPVAVVYAATDAAAPPSLKKQLDSIEQQRASLHRQLGGKAMGAAAKATDPLAEPAAYFIDPLPMLPIADCDRLDKASIESLIAAAAKKQSLDPALLRAVMKQESGFKPCAVSVRGAQGLMQLMPATAGLLHVEDPFDPEQNVQGGAAFLKRLLGRYKGDLRLALVAYNAGTLRADQPATAPYPLETQNYLASIFAQLGMTPEPAALDDVETSPEMATLPAAEIVSQPAEAPAAEPEQKSPKDDASPAPDKPATPIIEKTAPPA